MMSIIDVKGDWMGQWADTRWANTVWWGIIGWMGTTMAVMATDTVLSPSIRPPLTQAMERLERDQGRMQHPVVSATTSQWVAPIIPTESVGDTWHVTVNAIRLSRPWPIGDTLATSLAGPLGGAWHNSDLLALGQRLTQWCWNHGWIYTYVVPHQVINGVLALSVHEGRVKWVDANGLSPWEMGLAFGHLEAGPLNAWHIERGLSRINRVGQVRWRWVPHPTEWGEGGVALSPFLAMPPRVTARYQLDALYWYQPASIEVVMDRPFHSLDQLTIAYATSVSHERVGITHITLSESIPWGPVLWRFTHARSSFMQVVEGIYRPVIVTGQNESNRLGVEWEWVRDQHGIHTVVATYQASVRAQRVNGITIPITQQQQWVMGVGWVWQPWHPSLTCRLYPLLTWSDGYQKLYVDGSVNGTIAGLYWQWGMSGQYGMGEVPPSEYMGMGSGGALGGFDPSYFEKNGLMMTMQLSHTLWGGTMTYQSGVGWIARDGDVAHVGVRLSAISAWRLGGISMQLGWEQGIWASHANPIGGVLSGLSIGL